MQEVLGFPRKNSKIYAQFSLPRFASLLWAAVAFVRACRKVQRPAQKNNRFLSLDGRPIFRQESGECVTRYVHYRRPSNFTPIVYGHERTWPRQSEKWTVVGTSFFFSRPNCPRSPLLPSFGSCRCSFFETIP